MQKRLIVAILAVGLAVAPAFADPASCYDAAVIARPVHYDWLPYAAPGPDIIVMRSPARLTLEVHEQLAGLRLRSRITAIESLHTRYRDDDFLFLLRRETEGAFAGQYVVDRSITFVSDRRGRAVLPIFKQLEPGEIFPNDWIGPAYETALQPVTYDGRAAPWFVESEMSEAEFNIAPPGWLKRTALGVVAQKGLILKTYLKALERTPGWLCKRQ